MLINIFVLFILFFSIVIHEVAHGSVAYKLGDPTAKYAGRLTLNPIKHIDPVGTIFIPLMLFLFYSASGFQGPIVGWAKPVPINPYNFRDQRWGVLKVSAAGPLTNFLIALIFGLLIRFLVLPDSLFIIFSIITLYNFLWGLFNLIPASPLDGSHILLSFAPESWNFRMVFSQYGFFLLILFILFGGLEWLFRGAIFLFSAVSGYNFPV